VRGTIPVASDVVVAPDGGPVALTHSMDTGTLAPSHEFPTASSLARRRRSLLEGPSRPDSMALRRLLTLLLAGASVGCSRSGGGSAAATGPAAASEAAVQGAEVPAPPPARRAPPDALNVLLITIDTLRADHLSCYGYARKTSPCIDALAAQAVLFEECLVQWPKTGPSMASLLTSTYGSTNGVMRRTLDIKVPLHYDLLPELMQRAGWNTLGVVSNISLSEKFHFDQGFDRFAVHAGDQCRADAVTTRATDLLAERDTSKPYFLWVHYLDPHAPYVPPRRHIEPFLGDALWQADARPPLPVDPRVADPAAPAPENQDIGMIPAYAHFPARYPWVKQSDKDQARNYVAAYDGDVRYVDEHVGKLLDWMMAADLLRTTIIVLAADHGEGLGEHDYWFEHGRFPYDDCVHVPLMVVHPDWKARRVATPVALLDVAPTIAELTGVANGWQFEGKSLAPWLAAGAPEEQARPVFVESGYSERYEFSLRRGKWKLIRVGSPETAKLMKGGKYELYDVVADPGETQNLYDDAAAAAVVDSLTEELEAFVAAAAAKKAPDAEGATLTEEERAQMKALGYGEEGGKPSGSSDGN